MKRGHESMTRRQFGPRAFAASGALACGLAVALGAYASHGVEGQSAARLGLAALMLFGHGLALQVWARSSARALVAIALSLWLAGLMLFSGSLIAAVALATPTTWAPIGGSFLMLGWLALAVAAWLQPE